MSWNPFKRWRKSETQKQASIMRLHLSDAKALEVIAGLFPHRATTSV